MGANQITADETAQSKSIPFQRRRGVSGLNSSVCADPGLIRCLVLGVDPDKKGP
jgi:hypothetical protein